MYNLGTQYPSFVVEITLIESMKGTKNAEVVFCLNVFRVGRIHCRRFILSNHEYLQCLGAANNRADKHEVIHRSKEKCRAC